MDLIKAIDKVWHKGLVFKIEKYGIKGNLVKWLTSYLSNRKQKVVINGNSSDIKCLKACVPQGCMLGLLLFLLYIDDFCKNVLSEGFMFADDTVYMLFSNNISPSQVPQDVMVISDCNRYSNTSTLASFLHQIYLGQNIYLQSLLKPINVLVFLKRTNISYPENL